MEKLTTDNQKYFYKIIEELTDFDTNGKFIYCEVGQILTHGFSIQYQEDPQTVMKMKVWNSKYEVDRFKLGIFNLGRLVFNKTTLDLNPDELRRINQLTEKDLKTKEAKGIVLDGLHCQLQIDNKMLKWNLDDEMGDSLKKLVRLIRKKASAQQKINASRL